MLTLINCSNYWKEIVLICLILHWDKKRMRINLICLIFQWDKKRIRMISRWMKWYLIYIIKSYLYKYMTHRQSRFINRKFIWLTEKVYLPYNPTQVMDTTMSKEKYLKLCKSLCHNINQKSHTSTHKTKLWRYKETLFCRQRLWW